MQDDNAIEQRCEAAEADERELARANDMQYLEEMYSDLDSIDNAHDLGWAA